MAFLNGMPVTSLLVTTLVTRFTQQFAMLLLSHALAALFNNGAHLALPII